MADAAYLQERINATKAAIVQYEQARIARTTGAQSYRLGTGQTDQSVVRATLDEINRTLRQLRGELVEYEAELAAALSGPASVYVRPLF